MPTIFDDPSTISLVARLAQDGLRLECEGHTLPAGDYAILCRMSSGARVRLSLSFADDDPERSFAAYHLDETGQILHWSAADPYTHEFGCTGNFIPVTLVCTASGIQRTALIRIKIRPKTDKPF